MVATQPEHVHNDRFDSEVAAACHQACIVIVVNIEISSGDVEGPEQSIRAKQQAYGKQKQQNSTDLLCFVTRMHNGAVIVPLVHPVHVSDRVGSPTRSCPGSAAMPGRELETKHKKHMRIKRE